MNIEHIADLAGVDVATAAEWVSGDWTESSTPASAEEHAAWIAQSTDEAIASWIKAGQ